MTEKNKMEKKMCLCQCMRSTLNVCRIFGFCPLSWKHVEDKCIYSVSKFWIVYSIVYSALHLAYWTKILSKITKPFENDRALLLQYISSINENTAIVFIVILVFLNIFRAKKIARIFNKCASLSKSDLLCQLSLNANKNIHTAFCSVLVILYAIQYCTILLLNLMDSFDTNWNYDRFLLPIIQNTPLIFTALVGSACTVFVTLLGCYEKVMMYHLKFSPVHPLPNFDETDDPNTILGMYNLQSCKRCHNTDTKLNKLQTVEHLKWLHKKISDNIDIANESFSPQILLYMTFEIIQLVFHCYALIVYFTYENTTPVDSTINFFNWIFVIVHSLELFLFLDIAQHVETSTKKLINVLLEYSTRISTPEEYQQIRIFVESLVNAKGLNASGVFYVNLRIAAPIAANILMYILVAVQFKFPKNEDP